MKRLQGFAVCALLAAAPLSIAHAASGVVRASALVGDELDDSRGWQIARIEDVLVDPAEDRVALIVLRVGSRFQAPGAPVALSLPDAGLSAFKGHLRTSKSMEDLGRLPSLASVLDTLDAEKKKRLISMESLLDASVHADSGASVGELQDAVFQADSGSLRYVIVKSGSQAPGGSRELAIANADLRAGAGADNAVFVVTDADVKSARVVDEKAPELQTEGFLNRLARRLGFS